MSLHAECFRQLVHTDGYVGWDVKSTDMSNESGTLVTVSIKLEDPGSGGISRVHLGGTH